MCFFATGTPNTCTAITASNCATVVDSGNALDDAKCSAYYSTCFAKSDGSACMSKGNCSTYSTAAGVDCTGKTGDDGKCFWSTTCQAVTASNCSIVVKGSGANLTDATCTAYHSSCIAKGDGSACMLKAACSTYTTAGGVDCLTGSDGKCFWTSSSSTCTAIASGTNCATVVKASLDDA